MTNRPLRIGVLALQGGVAEHMAMLRRLGAEAVEVRLPAHLDGLDGIILPGGESTTIGKLLVEYGLLDPLRRRLRTGLPAYGTCAGMILLANDLGDTMQPGLDVLDVTVRRNAFGSQRDSFEQDLAIEGLEGAPFHAVFIRAPIIERLGPGVVCLARLAGGTPVAARQDRLLVSAFHPELGGDTRFHQLFLDMCAVPVAA
jgi:pyridoxal 5'-phosphate synthase pdxT subunit